MAKEDPNAPVTNKKLDDAIGTVVKGMDNLFKRLVKEMRDGLKQTNSRFDKLEVEVRGVKDDVRGVTAELSDTPSREQFEKLKAKVDKYHPIS